MDKSNSTSSTGDGPNEERETVKPGKAGYFFSVTFAAFALPGLLVSLPFLFLLLLSPGVIVAGPILLATWFIFFFYYLKYRDFHRAVCEGRIPQSTFARLLPFYLPLFYALIITATAYYRYDGHTHKTVFFFLCSFPFYAAWTLFVAYLVTYNVSLRIACLYLPQILSAVTALYGTYYILRYAPAAKHQKRDLLAVLLATTLLAATTSYFHHRMRTRILTPFPDVEVAKEEIDMMSPQTDLKPFQPFTGSDRLPNVEAPTLEIHEEHPKMCAAFSLYPVAAAGMQTTYRDLEKPYYSFLMGGTSPEAFHLLLFNSFDMAFVFRPSEKQREEAKRAGKELEITPIGREAFVFIVNKNNPVNGLTTQQIRDIYTKRITNWRELGGPDRKIMPFQRPEGSGSQTAMLRVMDGTPLPEPLREEYQHSMGGIIVKVADYRNYENSLGYSFRFYVTSMFPSDGVKMIAVDGVEPTLENIRSGAYPFIDELCIVTDETRSENVRKLVDWCLSPQGQDVIERVGYVSIDESDGEPAKR